MDRQTVADRIRTDEARLRELGVARLGLFGSLARGDAGPSSDIDIVIDITPGQRFSLLDLSGVYARLSGIVGENMDLVVSDDLPSEFKRRIEQDRVEVF